MSKNEIEINFCIWDFDDISHDELTTLIGIKPTRLYTKGKSKSITPDFLGYLAKENGWILSSRSNKNSSFEDHMNSLANVIESKMDILESICRKYYCEFSCSVFIKNKQESPPSIHINSKYNKLFEKLGAEFDIDIH